MTALACATPLEIAMPAGSEDFELFAAIWNQGIDAYLKAFCRGEHRFAPNPPLGRRLVLTFHPNGIPTLLRRLLEHGSDEADMWVDDIVRRYYEAEPLT